MLDVIAFDDRSQKHPGDTDLPEWLPKHEFFMLIVAPAGSGKTTLLLNIILRAYAQYWQRIFIFSPTINNDAKWEHVKKAKNVLMSSERQEERFKKKGASNNESMDSAKKEDKNKKKPKEKGSDDWCVSEEVDAIMNMKENHIIDPFDLVGRGSQARRRRRIGLSKEWYERAVGKSNDKDNENQNEEESSRIYAIQKKIQRDTLLTKNQRMNKISAVLLRPPVPEMHKQLKDLSTSVFKDTSSSSSKMHKRDIPQPKKEVKKVEGNTDNSIDEDDLYEEYAEDNLMKVMDEIDDQVKNAKKEGKELTEGVDRTLWVFDDMVGSGLFNNKRDNAFKRLSVRRRHYYSSVIGVTQAYKEIPRTARTNTNCLILFRIDSEEELKLIYMEYPMGLKYKDWVKIVDYCTREPYTFALFNLQTSDLDNRIVKNFDEPLSIETQTQLLGHNPRESVETEF